MPFMTLIIHGWSDQGESFTNLKAFLSTNGFPADSIYYGDWLSREDNITYNDVCAALNYELYKRGFIDDRGNGLVDLNVIVHSTGGLIIRHWISQYYFHMDDETTLARELKRCPVKNIVMLAPANFGSPLAEMGKSWIGGIIKGTHQPDLNFFSTGRQILNGLELGSEYQWVLAHRDLIRIYPYFSSAGIQTTVLVGTTGYGGVAGFFADKPGSDGTVIISGCNLNSVKFSLVPPPLFDKNDNKSGWQYVQPPLEVAFCTFSGLNHRTIIDTANTGSFILNALSAGTGPNREVAFKEMMRTLDAQTAKVYASGEAKQYQQFIVHVQDEDEIAIKDFTLEFLVIRKSGFGALVDGGKSIDDMEQSASLQFQDLMGHDVNSYSQNASFRSFLVDVDAAKDIFAKADRNFKEEAIPAFRVYVPEVDDLITYDLKPLHIVALDASIPGNIQGTNVDHVKPDFLYPNTTTLMEINVRRISTNTAWVSTIPTKHA